MRFDTRVGDRQPTRKFIKEVIRMPEKKMKQEKTLREEQEEIKDFVQVLLHLPEKDRAVILMNANAFRVRNEVSRIESGESKG